MTMRRSGVSLALFQAGLLLLVGLTFWMERLISPRLWALAQPVDPNLPIRGRYVSLRLLVPLSGAETSESTTKSVILQAQGDRLVAQNDGDGERYAGQLIRRDGQALVELTEPLALFIPPDVKDPSRRSPTDPLWVEVTLPRSGAPRPIQLGVLREGRLRPLSLR
ncbi:hypothetical protein [Synechococcus sp. UW140]|uniref:hypothetical protein n=1 Tax=Synechococcus sp. UW140 TaxID=368503 RepID=UPI000E0ECC1B|nr:hypothetical protein [Synechococcus sp. UW140]